MHTVALDFAVSGVIKIGVTINDIAKCAHVAPSTVSRVITGSPLISEKTCEKVRKVMKEMNYHPNIIARSLARKSTRIIGTLIPGTSEKAFKHPFFPEILRGMTSAADKCGYHILLSNTGNNEDEKKIINDFVGGGVTEGIILMTSRVNDSSIDSLVSNRFPFVMVGRPDSDRNGRISWVDNDNYNAGYLLARHLIERGHRRIAFIGVSSGYMVLLDRFNGYKKALAEAGIPFDESLVIDGQFMNESGYEMIKALYGRGRNFTGVIAGDDFQAFEVISFLTGKGINVPDDVAVAGFNNVPLDDFFIPPLTSVNVNAYKLGEKALELLIARLKHRSEVNSHIFVPTDMIIRKST